MSWRVRKISRHVANILPTDVLSLLDVGTGTGEMDLATKLLRPEIRIFGVDVYIRPKTSIPIVQCEGKQLPYKSGSVDAVTILDVLHHCNDPLVVLKECARVSKKWIVVKDHVSNSFRKEITLRFMDWIGNRTHGVALPYNYFSSSDWESAFKQVGLQIVREIDRLDLYPKPFDFLFGGSLHCFYLLKKS